MMENLYLLFSYSQVSFKDMHGLDLGFSGDLVKNLPALQETWVLPLGLGRSWRREWQFTPVFWRIPMDRGAWWATVCHSLGSQRVTDTFFSFRLVHDNLLGCKEGRKKWKRGDFKWPGVCVPGSVALAIFR